MTSRRLLSPMAMALLLLACHSASGVDGRIRAARPVPVPPAVQWNHEWARGAVFYEIFVRSFSDSNGDGIGDFNGLTAKLDTLNDGDPTTTTDLGIDAIWLMPVFQSPSYHGYDTVDYQTIEQDYGTNADFQRFLEAAHKRGIRVILDLVMNHTSSESPWFLDSASSPTSQKRNWYVWSATDPGWRQPWGGDPSWHLRNGSFYYGVFWSGMPDLNYRTPEVKAEMFRIARYWLSQGVDGFRLDATRYLVETGPGPGQADIAETHQLLKEFAADVRATRADAVLVAENTTDTAALARYYGSTATIRGGDEMPMNFNFPLASAVLESVKSGNASRIRSTLRDVINAYPRGIIDAPFLTNHDQTRLATVLSNDAGKLRNAAAILLTLPGAPFLYYGEEVGLQNGPTSADESKRTPMPWSSSGGFTSGAPWHAYAPGLAINNVASQVSDPRSLLWHYRKWIAARKSSAALLRGELTLVETGSQTLAFLRETAEERVLVVHNVSDSMASTGVMAIDAAGFEVLSADGGVAVPSGRPGSWSLSLPARSSGVWRLR
ncbi:MAG: alpha-amylase family glycosyl hydrolase [Thermoanaerobaculia bacterium]